MELREPLLPTGKTIYRKYFDNYSGIFAIILFIITLLKNIAADNRNIRVSIQPIFGDVYTQIAAQCTAWAAIDLVKQACRKDLRKTILRLLPASARFSLSYDRGEKLKCFASAKMALGNMNIIKRRNRFFLLKQLIKSR